MRWKRKEFKKINEGIKKEGRFKKEDIRRREKDENCRMW